MQVIGRKGSANLASFVCDVRGLVGFGLAGRMEPALLALVSANTQHRCVEERHLRCTFANLVM